jgi:hypothetical protein
MKIKRHETGPRISKAVIHGDTFYLAGKLPIARKVKYGRADLSILSHW